MLYRRPLLSNLALANAAMLPLLALPLDSTLARGSRWHGWAGCWRWMFRIVSRWVPRAGEAGGGVTSTPPPRRAVELLHVPYRQQRVA